MKQAQSLPKETKIYGGLNVLIVIVYFCLTGVLVAFIPGDRLTGLVLCAVSVLFVALFLWGLLRHRKDAPIVLNRENIYFTRGNKHLSWDKIARCYINNKTQLSPLAGWPGKTKTDRTLVVEFIKGGTYQHDISDYMVTSSRLQALIDGYSGRTVFDAKPGKKQLRKTWLMLGLYVVGILLALCLLSLVSCSDNRSFDRQSWDQADSEVEVEEMRCYPYRKAMVHDVLDNHLRQGMLYQEVKNLLGDVECHTEADDQGNIVMTYGFEDEYGTDIDPQNAYWLEITFSPDSLLMAADYKDRKHDEPLYSLSE